MAKGATIPIIPNKPEEKPAINWTPNKEQMEVMNRIHPRIQLMLTAREPYMEPIRRALLNYDAVSRVHSKDKRDETIVMPLSKSFVEAKTSEEIRAFNEYKYIPRAESRDSWKVQLMEDMNRHYQMKTKMKSKKYKLLRMKNLAGISIARVGYRKITRKIKERVMDNEDAININWEEKESVMYDDLFFDIVSPLDFAIDPNASTIEDAMDCVQFSTRNYEDFLEVYGGDPRFDKEAIEAVKPGIGVEMTEGKMTTKSTNGNNLVGIWEHFDKIRDEWNILVNGILITKPGNPLPDDHKELPFIAYHNDPSFVTESVAPPTQFSPNSGKEVSRTDNINGSESFWTKGDPEVIRDLVELYTGFSRAMFRNAKLSGESLVLTRGNFRIDTSRPWRTGDPIVGGADKVQTMPLANPNTPNMERMFDILMQAMILSTGIDPRNLVDDVASRTATQAAIIRETSMKRLEANIQFNEENGETRLGELGKELMIQYYSKPEIKRLTGAEEKEELKSFHDVEKDTNTGLPKFGKTFRRIPSTIKLKESKKGKSNGEVKYYLTKSEEGVNSFLARPEYIRVSEVSVITSNDRRLSEIRAVKIAQAKEGIELVERLVQHTVPMIPGAQPIISPEDIPNLRSLSKLYVTSLGLDPETDMGNGVQEPQSEFSQLAETIEDPTINPTEEQLQGVPAELFA